MEFKGEMSVVVGSSCELKEIIYGKKREALYCFSALCFLLELYDPVRN
jgi:hypothetical protein